ncbi:hypothetical protein SteCoe_29690 [Stentor coeruleus]|uniref:Uncharacterized protein n=1 Tax=Stentor coeruleus TaxID=5963 RepID=A0A1R2B5B8_9CILI|nr:hypothetical protein SteCoe_29690 [Stentor coeruleus]
MDYEEYQAKVILIGECGVGKSSLLDVFVMNKFNVSQETTVGGSFKSKYIKDGKRNIKLNIWDTAGQERYQSLTKMYCRGANAAILIYDITSQESFDCLKKWHQIVLESGNDDITFIVVGNKEDLIEKEQVKLEDAVLFANKIGGYLKKTSAKNDFGVTEMFTSVALRLFPNIPVIREGSLKPEQITLSMPNPKKKKKCCS